jgi:RNA polymerase sigma-70 factor (ECF subfamily)
MDSRSDQELMERTAGGDAMALKTLYQRYEIPVFNLILRGTSNRELAQDLLQETFTRLWTMAHLFDPRRGAVKSWLFTMALNLTRTEMSKRVYDLKPVSLDDAPPCRSDDPEVGSGVEGEELQNEVARVLDKLPAHYREVIVLKYFHHLTFDEIARMTGAPAGTLRARFHRAVARLRSNIHWKDFAP